jgi:hypothetical protein
MLLEPGKAQLVAMTIACLHNLLRRSPDSAAIYILRLARLIESKWRATSNENMNSLFPVRNITCKPILKAKEVREELAAYFLSGERVEWQNDCT